MDNKNTRVYLVRHAESEANDRKTYTGWLDVDLSERGVMQARSSAGYFSGIDVDSIYTSTLKRAYRTAHMIFGDDAEVKRMEEFREMNLGVFETKTHSQLLTEFPELYRNWVADPTAVTPEDAENIHDHHNRVTSGLMEVISENAGKNAAIVTHGGVIRSILVHTLNMNLRDIWRLKVDNLSVTVVEYSGDMKSLVKLNDTCHLRGEVNIYE